MKLAAFIFTVALCAGCASQVPDTNPAHVVQSAARRIQSFTSAEPQPEVVLPPPPSTNGMIFHFTFSVAVTNCYLQSSLDLVHWVNRYDFSLETNADGTVGWHLPPNPDYPGENYRVGGEEIP